MKSLTIILSACLLVGAAGCVTKNPNYQPPPADQNPVVNPQIVPNTAAISNAVVLAHAINDASAPVNPYAAPTDLAIEGVAGVVTALSLLLAKIKSNQAAAHKSAVDTMALAISKQPNDVVQDVVKAAANSGASDHAIITNAINDNSV